MKIHYNKLSKKNKNMYYNIEPIQIQKMEHIINQQIQIVLY